MKVNVFLAVPSTAPSNLTVIVNNSTTVTASWRLPPEIARNGIIRGFRLLYKKKDSGGLPAILNIRNGTIHSQVVTGLDKYSEYEFQVVAFTSVGDGPKSSVVVKRTKEDGEKTEKFYKSPGFWSFHF